MIKTFNKKLLTTASAFAISAVAAGSAYAVVVDLDATGSNYDSGTGDTNLVESNDVVLGASVTHDDAVGITLSSSKNLSTGTKNVTGVTVGINTDAGVDSTTSTGTTLTVTASSVVTSGNGTTAVEIGNAIAGVSVLGTITGATTGTGLDLQAAVTDGVSVGATGIVQSATTGVGIDIGANNALTIASGGKVLAGGAGKGIQVTGGTTSTISNAGSIGTIGTGGIGIDVDAAMTSITNSGSITATVAGLGIDVGASVGTITNSGTISGASGAGLINVSGAATTDITNSGSITLSGAGIGIDVEAKVTGTITNSGSISAVAGVGVDLGADVTGGLINSGTISDSGAGQGIDVTAAVGTGGITNSGSISTVAGTGIQVGANVAASITNSGTITETSGKGIDVTSAITTSGSSVTNSGSIGVSTGVGIDIGADVIGGIVNSGTIAGSGAGTGIDVTAATTSSTASVTNSGSISNVAGTGIDAGADVAGGVTNSGTISDTGAGIGIDISVANTSAAITNSGSITTVGGAGIDIGANATKGVTNSGTITETTGSGISYTAASNAAVTNSGTITATTGQGVLVNPNAALSGTFTNSGSISATTGEAIDIDAIGADFTIVNSGTLASTSGTVIDASGEATGTEDMILTNTGSITAANATTAAIVGSAGADILHWNGGSITGTINLGADAGDTINVGDSSSDSITTGGAISGIDVLTVKQGTFNIGHAISSDTGTETFTINSTGTAIVTSDVSVDFENLAVNGTLEVTNGVTLTMSDDSATDLYTVSNGGTVKLEISKNSDVGKIVATAGTSDFNFVTGSTLNFDVEAGTEQITAGELTDVITADDIQVDGTTATATTLGNAITVTDNSYALAFAISTNSDATGLDVTVTRENAYNTASSKANESAVGAALEAIGNGGDANLDSIVGALDSLSTAAAVESALETLNSDVSGAVTAAANSASDAAVSVVGNRLSQIAGVDGTAVATGGAAYEHGVWAEVFGTSADQSDRDGVKGYQADTAGIAIGADTKVSDQGTLGLSFAYANTDADSANGEAEIGSYQVNVYGSYDYGKWYSEGLVGVTFNDYETKRNVVVGSISDQAKGDFDGQQYTIQAGVGYKLDVEGGLNVTPKASARYNLTTIDAYSETGSTANLRIDNDDLHRFEIGTGVDLNYPIMDGSITYIPSLSVGVTYDLVGDEQETKNNFTGASSTVFTNKGADVAKVEFEIGAGLDILAQDNLTVSFDYDWTSKEDYNAHTGAVKARFAF